MPFLGGLGQAKIGRGFFAVGKKPDLPTNLTSTPRKWLFGYRLYSTRL